MMHIRRLQGDSGKRSALNERVTKVDLERLDKHLKQYLRLLKAKATQDYPPMLKKVA